MNYTRPSSPRILIASENPLEAQRLETMLRAARFNQVRVTTDLRQVSALFIKWRFRLLILDLSGARMNGADVFKGLADPIRTGEMSVLGLTDPGDETTRLGAVTAGAVGVMTRPLSMARTLPQIETVLKAVHLEG